MYVCLNVVPVPYCWVDELSGDPVRSGYDATRLRVSPDADQATGEEAGARPSRLFAVGLSGCSWQGLRSLVSDPRAILESLSANLCKSPGVYAPMPLRVTIDLQAAPMTMRLVRSGTGLVLLVAAGDQW